MTPAGLLPQNLPREIQRAFPLSDDNNCWSDEGEHRNNYSAVLREFDDTHHAIASVFELRSHNKHISDAYGIHQFQHSHGLIPLTCRCENGTHSTPARMICRGAFCTGLQEFAYLPYSYGVPSWNTFQLFRELEALTMTVLAWIVLAWLSIQLPLGMFVGGLLKERSL